MKCIYFGLKESNILKHKHFSNRIHLRIVNYKDIKLKPMNCLFFFNVNYLENINRFIKADNTYVVQKHDKQGFKNSQRM